MVVSFLFYFNLFIHSFIESYSLAGGAKATSRVFGRVPAARAPRARAGRRGQLHAAAAAAARPTLFRDHHTH